MDEISGWVFGIESYLVANGTYPTVEIGHELEASLEFAPLARLAVVGQQQIGTKHQSHNCYEIVAAVVEVGEFLILDVGGISVSCWARALSQAAELKAGTYVAGTVRLGINSMPWYAETEPLNRHWIPEAIACATFAEQRLTPTASEPVTVLDADSADHPYLLTCKLLPDH